MNKLNGGYIMIDATSSTLQADLKKAYETGKPVLYYDATGKAEFATIVKNGDAYYVFKVNDCAKKYNIEITFDGSGDIPENDVVYLTLVTKDNLLYMNSTDAEVADDLRSELLGYTPECRVSPQTISTYDVLDGFLTDEGTIIIIYNDSGAVKRAVLESGSAKTIKTTLY